MAISPVTNVPPGPAPTPASPAVPPLPAPVTTPPSSIMAPDTFVKGLMHGAEEGVADLLDELGKVPFLHSLGVKLYGLMGGKGKPGPEVDNLGGLSPNLYRGAQPSDQAFARLSAEGVKTIVNLRAESDAERATVQKLGMKYVYIPEPPVGPPTNDQATKFLSAVTDPANGKCFFHCRHGADRTGAMAAAYRIAIEGWTADQAIAEMPNYKFHAGFEDEKIVFVRQFADYWASLTPAQRSQITHGQATANPAPASAANGAADLTPDKAPPASSGPAGGSASGSASPAMAAGPSAVAGGLGYQAGNSVKLFVGRPNTYQEALDLINHAKTSIQFESFTFNGQMGLGVAQALIAARARGVNVQVVLDSKAMFAGDERGLRDLLRSHGVDVREYQERGLHDPLVAIDHAKMLLVDGQTALVGDSNFDRHVDYDLDYEVQGPAVPHVQQVFTQDWGDATPGVVANDGLPAVAPVPVATGAPVAGGDTSIGITQTAPKDDPSTGAQTYHDTLDAIHHSRKSIDVLMYTMDDAAELSALQQAAKRGVQVRVVLNPSKRWFNEEAVRELQKAGIQVKWFTLSPGMSEMHAKVAVFDGQTVLGGSTNWVHSSNADNHELGVWMQGPVAGQVEQTFQQVWDRQSTAAPPVTGLAALQADVVDVLAHII